MSNERQKFESIAERPALELEFENSEVVSIISDEDFKTWEGQIEEIRQYMVDNHAKGKSEEEKNDAYQGAQDLWNKYLGKNGLFNDTKFNLILNRKEYNMLSTLLRDKIEYDVNTLFFAMELLKFMDGELKDAKFESDDQHLGFGITQTDMTLLYTLLSQHKCKGLGSSTQKFAMIIKRIADMSKVINHMSSENNDLSTEIQNWVVTFEEGVTQEG